MASTTKNVLRPLLRREVLSTASPVVGRGVGVGVVSSTPITTSATATQTARSSAGKWAGRRAGVPRQNGIVQRRAFSGTARGREEVKQQDQQEDEASFDPAQMERESDEVDVCIVGGGAYAKGWWSIGREGIGKKLISN